jgi:hypothetical protein
MGARGWLWAHHELAKARSRVAADALRAQSDDGGPSDEVRGMLDAAIGDWKIMNDACPAYLDTSFQYARALALAGREDEARACIEGYLTNLNPYDRASNLLFLSLSPSSAQTALTCVRRGLRTSRTDTILVGHALGALASEEVVDSWPAMVETARRDLDGGSPGDWEDPLAPETLRVEALRLATRGKRAEAAQLQRRVAMAYADLARVSPVERSSDVQSDTWYLAARFAFDADPGECDRAHRTVRDRRFRSGCDGCGHRSVAGSVARGAAAVRAVGEVATGGGARNVGSAPARDLEHGARQSVSQSGE